VRVRLSNDESDHIDWYEPAADNNPLNAEVAIDPDRDELDQQRAQVDEHNQLVRMFYDGIGEDFAAQAQAAEALLRFWCPTSAVPPTFPPHLPLSPRLNWTRPR
jgi:hypothetical protein